MPSTGQAAKRIGVNLKTITNWIDREELSRFFSQNAGKERITPHRQLTHADMDVLLTINYLLNVSKKNYDWDRIAKYLESGNRETEYPVSGRSLDTKSITLDQAEQSARSAATMAERDAALRRVSELESRIEAIQTDHKEEMQQLRDEHKKEVERLLQEIRNLYKQVGRLEGRLEDE